MQSAISETNEVKKNEGLGISILTAKPDSELSPYTGYTRAHWLEITEKIIAGVMPYFNPKSGLPELPFQDGGFEDFRGDYPKGQVPGQRAMERIMLAVIFYTKATGNDFVPGFKGSISQPFIKAITQGTDPDSKYYWGDPLPNDQVGTVFSLAVYTNPELFWNPLSNKQKENLLNWMEKQEYSAVGNNNFYYFRLANVAFLDANKRKCNREHLSELYQRLFGWHRGDGWFMDGKNRGFDYYNNWAFHMYNGMIYHYDPVWRKQFGNEIEKTTALFLNTLKYLYGRDGAPVPWGRSLSYRFACNAPIGWSVLNGTCPLPVGQARRMASGALKYFWEQGCLDKNTGLLELGYRSHNESVAEMYLNPGDTYWAMQGMSCLLIPENDPFWKDVEQPIPADNAGGKIVVNGLQSVIRVNPIDGESRMFPVGQPFFYKSWMGQVGSKYAQHAYSSTLGFCTLGEGLPDNGAGRSGYSFDGQTWYYRENAKPLKISEDQISSTYPVLIEKEGEISSPLYFDDFFTHTLIGNDGEVHILWHNHYIPIYIHIGGYGIQITNNKKWVELSDDAIVMKSEQYASVIQSIKAPSGTFESVLLEPRQGWTSTHLFGGKGAYPYWHSKEPVKPNVPIIFYVNGAKGRACQKAEIKVQELPGLLRIQFEGKCYSITIPNL
jgi:hypothetical protein